MTTQEKIAAITTHQSDPAVRVARNVPIGKALHQGDVYVHRVADDHPCGAQLGTRQVAVGNTQGARHVAEGDVRVFSGAKLPDTFVAPAWLNGTPPEGIFLGPVVVAGAEWSLTHPEHADHKMPAGCYQITYQGDPRWMSRVAD